MSFLGDAKPIPQRDGRPLTRSTPSALHVEDEVDRLLAEQPDAVDLAAAGERGQDACDGSGVAVAVRRTDVRGPPGRGVRGCRRHRRARQGLVGGTGCREGGRIGRRRGRRHDVRDPRPVRFGCACLEVRSQRASDLLGDELPQGPAGDPVHEFPDEVPVVHHVVAGGRARLPPRCLRGHPGRRAGRVVQVLHGRRLLKPGDAGGVGEQMADFDVPLAARGELGPVPGHRRVHVEFAPVHQHERSETGDGLRDRPHVGEGVLLPGGGTGDVAVPAPQVHDALTVDVHDQRGADLLTGYEVLPQCLPQAREAGLGRSVECGHGALSFVDVAGRGPGVPGVRRRGGSGMDGRCRQCPGLTLV